MDGVKFGKVGKLESCKIDQEMCRRSEEKLCKSILKGLAKRSREKHAMLADVEEGQEKMSYASMTSLERNYRGTQCARLANWS